MEFVRNTWYAAGWSDEISRTMLPRTFLNEPVLLYRKEDGTPVAIGDLCTRKIKEERAAAEAIHDLAEQAVAAE